VSERPRILVSNDDGHQSDGIRALVDAVSPLGEVWVVAPEAEQSASSHAISLHRPLRIRTVRERWYAVDGTPTDCSYVAINHVLKEARPQLMLSGINHGPNMADDVTYSGTVAAAMEASLLGVPAIAFSLVTRSRFDFGPAARFAARLTAAALARLGKHSYGFEVIEKTDPRGRKYYWIGGNEYQHENIPGTDCNAVLDDKLVSVTPLMTDLTDERTRAAVAEWTVEGYRRVDER
jgi:5'-nucleotidase